jgi:hypothetical protein
MATPLATSLKQMIMNQAADIFQRARWVEARAAVQDLIEVVRNKKELFATREAGNFLACIFFEDGDVIIICTSGDPSEANMIQRLEHDEWSEDTLHKHYGDMAVEAYNDYMVMQELLGERDK